VDRLLNGARVPRRSANRSLEAKELETAYAAQAEDDLEDEEDEEWEYEETRHLVIRVLGIRVMDMTLGTTRAGE
jgi:hypothetical protein